VDKGGNHIDPPMSEFLPLSTWLHELTAYNLMRRLPLFRTYLPRKMFRTWRNAAHARVYARARAAMLSNLFYAKPAFVSVIMDSSRLIHGVLSIPLMPFQGPKQVIPHLGVAVITSSILLAIIATTLFKQLSSCCAP
jgi:hypothetical protein